MQAMIVERAAVAEEREAHDNFLSRPQAPEAPDAHLRHVHLPGAVDHDRQTGFLRIWAAVSTPVLILGIGVLLTRPSPVLLSGFTMFLVAFAAVEAVARRRVRLFVTVACVALVWVFVVAGLFFALLRNWQLVLAVLLSLTALVLLVVNLREFRRRPVQRAATSPPVRTRRTGRRTIQSSRGDDDRGRPMRNTPIPGPDGAASGHERGLPRALIVLLGSASAVVVAAGIQATAWLVGPVFLALVIVITVHPVHDRLRRIGLPSWAATTMLVLVVYAVLVVLAGVVVVSVARLATILPLYAANANALLASVTSALAEFGVGIGEVRALAATVNYGKVLGLVSGLLLGVTSLLGNLVFLLSLLLFLSIEASGAGMRLERIAGLPCSSSGFDRMRCVSSWARDRLGECGCRPAPGPRRDHQPAHRGRPRPDHTHPHRQRRPAGAVHARHPPRDASDRPATPRSDRVNDPKMIEFAAFPRSSAFIFSSRFSRSSSRRRARSVIDNGGSSPA